MGSDGKQIVNYFCGIKTVGHLSGSYLLLGENPAVLAEVVKIAGCRAAASYCDDCWDCARLADGEHPDVMRLEADGVYIKIEQVREAIRFLSTSPYRLTRKILIVKDAHNLYHHAANAFLKTLEEVPGSALILVCAPSAQGLLPTIVSRCKKIFLPTPDSTEALCPAPTIAMFLHGERIKFTGRRQFLGFLTTVSFVLRDYLAQAHRANNRLLAGPDYEIILPRLNTAKALAALAKTLELQAVYNSVNENLALNMIRMEL